MMKSRGFAARLTTCVLASGIGAFCLSAYVLADAESDYQTLFGQEEAKVAASRNSKDAAAFATKLLNAAKSVAEQKELQVLLLEKAYDFGMKDVSAYQTAVDSMKLFAEVVPEKKGLAQERLLKAFQLRFAKAAGAERNRMAEEMVDVLVGGGDEKAAKQPAEAAALYRQALSLATGAGSGRVKEIMEKIKQIASRQEAEKRLNALKARVETAPHDVTARAQLILAYLGEFDDPVEAAKLVNSDLDESLRTYVPLAAKSVSDLPEAACRELAQWYTDMAPKFSTTGKAIVLARAKACCERYLEIHTAQDASRLKGKLLLDEVEKDLERLNLDKAKATALSSSLPGADSKRWIDLLKMADPARDTISGKLELKKGALYSDDQPNTRMEFPYRPPEEYDILCEYTAAGAVILLLPAKSTRFNLTMGGAGSGFDAIGGKNYWENPSTVRKPLPPGRKQVVVQVRKDGVKAFLDGKLFTQHKTDFSDMSDLSGLGLRSPGAIGISSWKSPTVFHAVRVREVTGKGVLLRDDKQKTGPQRETKE